MRAIILAAGRGSRLGHITNSSPKCMTKLWGKALINWQIDTLRKVGITDIGIVTGYQGEKITLDQVNYFNNYRWGKTNTLISLLTARTWLEKYDCLIAYSDILYTPNTISMLMNSQEEVVITYNTKFLELWRQRFEDPLIDLETFKTLDQSVLLEIGNQPKSIDEIEGQFMGLLKISPAGFGKIKQVLAMLDQDSIDKLDITGMLSRLLSFNIKVATIPCDDFWIEIDNLYDVELYESWNKDLIFQSSRWFNPDKVFIP